MHHAEHPRSATKPDGTTVFIADYQDRTGRHQVECQTEQAARLLKEEYDLRPNPNISLAGYLLHCRRYMLPGNSKHVYNNDRSALMAAALVSPDTKLVRTTASTIKSIRQLLEKPPEGIRPRSVQTIRNDLHAIKRALDRAVIDGRIPTNPARAFFSLREYRIPGRIPVPDVPAEVQFSKITPALSPHSARAFELAALAGLSYPEAVCVRPEFIDVAAGTLLVGLHWKQDNTIGPPRGVEPRVVRGLDRTWLEWLLEAPRYNGDDGFLLQALSPTGKPIGRRQMRERIAREIFAAQETVGMVSMTTGRAYKGKDLRGYHTVQQLTLRPNQLLMVQAMAGHASADYFTRKWVDYVVDEDSHDQMETTIETVDSLNEISAHKFNRQKLLDAWLRIGTAI